jgi:hypothetical protein
MVPISIGFFASLAVIILVVDGFPLKALLGIAVCCMAASYFCGLLLIGPTGFNASFTLGNDNNRNNGLHGLISLRLLVS